MEPLGGFVPATVSAGTPGVPMSIVPAPAKVTFPSSMLTPPTLCVPPIVTVNVPRASFPAEKTAVLAGTHGPMTPNPPPSSPPAAVFHELAAASQVPLGAAPAPAVVPWVGSQYRFDATASPAPIDRPASAASAGVATTALRRTRTQKVSRRRRGPHACQRSLFMGSALSSVCEVRNGCPVHPSIPG